MNRNVVKKITYNECKDVLLSNICLRHLMNRIQSKDYTIKAYEIKKTTLPCFDDNIYIYIYIYKAMDIMISSWLSELVV